MTELSGSWIFSCGSSVNHLITLHAKAEGKLERWTKNWSLGRNSWVAEKTVMNWEYSSILFLKFNCPALCRVMDKRMYHNCV